MIGEEQRLLKQVGGWNGRHGGKEVERTWRSPQRTGRAGCQLRSVRAHRQSADGVGPNLLRWRGQARRQRATRRWRIDGGWPKSGARLRHQSARASQGRTWRPRQGGARGAARRFREFGFPLYLAPEGDERRLRPNGRGIRRQGQARALDGWRRGLAAKCSDGSRGLVRSLVSLLIETRIDTLIETLWKYEFASFALRQKFARRYRKCLRTSEPRRSIGWWPVRSPIAVCMTPRAASSIIPPAPCAPR